MVLSGADAERHADVETESVNVVSKNQAVVLREDAKVIEAETEADAAGAEHVHAGAELQAEIRLGLLEVEELVFRLHGNAAEKHLPEASDAAGGAAAYPAHVGVDIDLGVVFEGLV